LFNDRKKIRERDQHAQESNASDDGLYSEFAVCPGFSPRDRYVPVRRLLIFHPAKIENEWHEYLPMIKYCSQLLIINY
jgi:hypothetical protein